MKWNNILPNWRSQHTLNLRYYFSLFLSLEKIFLEEQVASPEELQIL